MNHEARTHFPVKEIRPIDFAYIKVSAATAQDFNRCNACRYTFRQIHGRIDMSDFRQHKETCERNRTA